MSHTPGPMKRDLSPEEAVIVAQVETVNFVCDKLFGPVWNNGWKPPQRTDGDRIAFIDGQRAEVTLRSKDVDADISYFDGETDDDTPAKLRGKEEGWYAVVARVGNCTALGPYIDFRAACDAAMEAFGL